MEGCVLESGVPGTELYSHSLPLFFQPQLFGIFITWSNDCVCVCVCVCRRYEVAKLLGNHGAAVNLRGKSGSTAFDIANMLGEFLNLWTTSESRLLSHR